MRVTSLGERSGGFRCPSYRRARQACQAAMSLSPDGSQGASSASPANPSVQHKAVRFGNLEPAALTVVKQSTLPLTAVVTLALCLIVGGRSLSLQILGARARHLSRRIPDLQPARYSQSRALGRPYAKGRASHPSGVELRRCNPAFSGIEFDAHALPRDVLVAWYATTPIAMLIVERLSVPIARWVAADHPPRSAT